MRIDSTTASPLHYRALVENDHLGQWDFIDPATGKPREPTVVIESVTTYAPQKPRTRKMADGTRRPEKLNKLEIRFVGKRKSWIANPTCQEQIARLHGTRIQAWIGKKLKLYVDPDVMMGRAKVGGVRVRGVTPVDEPTSDPMDAEVDARLRAIQEEAFSDE
jgi:hypothetical protein